MKFGEPLAGALSTIVRSYKSAVSKQVNQFRNTPAAKLWHRNYYEHIIRNQDELAHIREYIRTNPVRWNQDENYSE